MQERDLNADNDFADANEVVYYHSSTLFSVYALSKEANQSVVERYRYDAYGSCTVLDADGSVDADGLSDVKNPYLFTSRRLDLESGLMQYRFRNYSPSLGRFITRDLAGYVDGPCLYMAAFVPNGRDPSGTMSLCPLFPGLTTPSPPMDEWRIEGVSPAAPLTEPAKARRFASYAQFEIIVNDYYPLCINVNVDMEIDQALVTPQVTVTYRLYRATFKFACLSSLCTLCGASPGTAIFVTVCGTQFDGYKRTNTTKTKTIAAGDPHLEDVGKARLVGWQHTGWTERPCRRGPGIPDDVYHQVYEKVKEAARKKGWGLP